MSGSEEEFDKLMAVIEATAPTWMPEDERHGMRMGAALLYCSPKTQRTRDWYSGVVQMLAIAGERDHGHAAAIEVMEDALALLARDK